MDASTLQKNVVAAVSTAINSGETSPGEAISVLECIKMDVHHQIRMMMDQAKQPKIVKATQVPDLGRNGNG